MPRLNDQPVDDGVSVVSLAAVRNAGVVALVVSLMFNATYFVPVETHSPHLSPYLTRATFLSPVDIVLLVLAVLSVPLLLRRSTYSGLPVGLIGALVYTGATVLLVLLEPSSEGLMRCVRIAGATGAIATIRCMSLRTFRATVVWPLSIAVAFQASIALAQTFVLHSGSRSGITERWGHAWTQGFGTMASPYMLGAFVVVAVAIILSAGAFQRLHPVMWISVALGSASIATVFGRAYAAGLLLVAAVYGLAWVVRRNGWYFASAAATAGPFLLGIVRGWAGWQRRASETGAGYLSGREALQQRALGIIEANPFFGVGPGQYGPTLARTGLLPTDRYLVESVPLLTAAEYGLPLGLLFVAWLVILGVLAATTSARAFGVFVAIVPILVFAYTPVVYPAGVMGFGLWLATLDYHRLHRTDNAASAVQQEQQQALIPA